MILTYLKISLLGFGGPNAHLALMLDEVVERRRWLTRERFLELMAVTNLLPGPNSSEVAIHVGYSQRGWTGALATGLTFLLPTFVMVTALSALYFHFGDLPQVDTVFWGLEPVIVAIVLAAGIKIGRAGVKSRTQGVLAALGAAVSLVSGQAIIAAMGVGAVVTWWQRGGGGSEDDRVREGGRADADRGAGSEPDAGSGAGGREDVVAGREGGGEDGSGHGSENGHEGDSRGREKDDAGGPERRGGWLFLPAALSLPALGTLGTVFWTHLWMGSVLFGGGYVLVALLQPYAVGQFGWLTSSQFLDGVALTQAVPGPISTLSAFVGYAAGGVPGAVLGTAGIYLPAFAAVLLVAPRLARLREVDAVRRALKGVVAVVAGAVLGVGVSLIQAGVQDVVSAAIAVAALVLATWKKVPSLWLVGGGLVAGVVRTLLA